MKHQNANNSVARTIYVRAKLHSPFTRQNSSLEMDFKFDFLSLLASGKKSIIRSSKRFPFGRIDDFSFHVAINSLLFCPARIEIIHSSISVKYCLLIADFFVFFFLSLFLYQFTWITRVKNGVLSYHRRSWWCFPTSLHHCSSVEIVSRRSSRDIIHYTDLWHTFFKLMNFDKIYCLRHFGQLHAVEWLITTKLHFSKKNNYEKLLSILFFIFVCSLPLFFFDTISGLKSKLLCWQQMSFKICLQSRNMCSLRVLAVHIQDTMLL